MQIDADLKLPDLGGVTKELRNMAETLQADALEELNQLADDLKKEVGDIEMAQIKAKARNAAIREQLNNLIQADDSATR